MSDSSKFERLEPHLPTVNVDDMLCLPRHDLYVEIEPASDGDPFVELQLISTAIAVDRT